ncbi:MAG: hypothetical protein AB9919_12565 [Geobacteraceae bacterium]
MRARIAGTMLLALLAPSAANAMSWCSERELMFDRADMCAAICPSSCTAAMQRTEGSSGPCGSGYRGFVFSPSLNRTYALTAGSVGVDGLASLPEYSAKGAVLKSATENGSAATSDQILRHRRLDCGPGVHILLLRKDRQLLL